MNFFYWLKRFPPTNCHLSEIDRLLIVWAESGHSQLLISVKMRLDNGQYFEFIIRYFK